MLLIYSYTCWKITALIPIRVRLLLFFCTLLLDNLKTTKNHLKTILNFYEFIVCHLHLGNLRLNNISKSNFKFVFIVLLY